MHPAKKKVANYDHLAKGEHFQSFHFLIYLNRCSIIFICAWFTWPFFNNKFGILPLIAFMALWLMTTNIKWIVHHLTSDLLLFFVWLLMLIPYIITGNFKYGEADQKFILISFSLFFIGVFFNHYYMYYKKNERMLGVIAGCSIVFFAIATIQTYLGLQKYPLAARNLATGDDPLMAEYAALGIGGFGYVYSVVFLNILLLYFIVRNASIQKIYKGFFLVIYVIIFATLISASYATSILLMIVGTLLVICIRGRKSFFFSLLLASICILFFSKDSIGYLLIDTAQIFESNNVVSSKLSDLARGFISESAGSQTSGRVNLYRAYLETFFMYPIFGIYGPFGNSLNAVVGGHSGWLDLLAYYGLFGSLPLFAVIYFNFRKHLLFFHKHPYYPYLLTCQILFILFGFINPVIYIYQLGFLLFMIAPALPFLPHAFRKIFVRGETTK